MTKLRCAILDDYQQVALSMADWSSIASQVNVVSLSQHLNEAELIQAIQNCEIVVIMRERSPFTAKVFERLPKLKLLVTSGMRNASIDLIAATKNGVIVCGTASAPEPPVELTWALILGLARHVVGENNALRQNGPWQNSVGVGLSGKQLGILGLGKIGNKVAKIAKAFGMNVVAWSQNLTQEHAQEAGVILADSKEELLEYSDFVSIHLVLSERTKNILGETELKLMKPSAYLINTSRAQIVDQSALLKALQEKWIAGAGLDVFDIEPLPKDHPYRVLDNVLAMPHLGYVTAENYQLYFSEGLEDIKAYLAGSAIRRLN
ncbi:MAG: 2-hydroxyacid dehydrogenase [Gammaproteobacteria bacterium]|jgi:phosphoglycerate dehydrogenase-like enzyme|nr:2-hydroxyacid dehydrogenase [Gammaproteobacteria bacterium]